MPKRQKSKESEDKRDIEEINANEFYMVTHPLRYPIIKYIEKNYPGGSYQTEIANELKIKRELVTFHLLQLEKAGLVEGSYGLKNPARGPAQTTKYYKLTKNGKNLLDKLGKIL